MALPEDREEVAPSFEHHGKETLPVIITVAAGAQGARVIILGGETLNGPRYVWWNFVSSSKEGIEEAKEQWRQEEWGGGLFDLPPDDRSEFIPLPQ